MRSVILSLSLVGLLQMLQPSFSKNDQTCILYLIYIRHFRISGFAPPWRSISEEKVRNCTIPWPLLQLSTKQSVASGRYMSSTTARAGVQCYKQVPTHGLALTITMRGSGRFWLAVRPENLHMQRVYRLSAPRSGCVALKLMAR